MKTQPQIKISSRAYSAVLASCARSVLAHDAKPILASDILPLLKGDWPRQRIAVQRGLAHFLRGRLASDQATPEETSRKLMAMLSDEPDKQSEYAEKMFGSKPVAKHDSIAEPDAGDDAAVAKHGFKNGEDEDDPVAQVMALVGNLMSPEDCDELQQFLSERLGGEDDEVAEDVPPPFSGQPLVGGGKRPLSQKADMAGDRRRLTRQAAQDSFSRRFPEVSRLAGAASPQYSDGTPVPDARLLGGSTTPRKSAMDSAPHRLTQSFAQRFPEAARIRSA